MTGHSDVTRGTVLCAVGVPNLLAARNIYSTVCRSVVYATGTSLRILVCACRQADWPERDRRARRRAQNLSHCL
jgi:hypothetical protein